MDTGKQHKINDKILIIYTLWLYKTRAQQQLRWTTIWP